jgi:hypothetical protein
MSDSASPGPVPAATRDTAAQVLRERAQVRAFIERLIGSAQRDIVIFAPTLDPALFDQMPVVEALAHFAARHRQNRARLLVEDAAQAIRDNDNLITLCRRLGEFIQLRRVDETHLGLREQFLVADRRGFLHQEDIARPECVAALAGGVAAARLAQRFEAMWDRAQVPEGLHTPGLA